jgi:hypothetical protein
LFVRGDIVLFFSRCYCVIFLRNKDICSYLFNMEEPQPERSPAPTVPDTVVIE